MGTAVLVLLAVLLIGRQHRAREQSASAVASSSRAAA